MLTISSPGVQINEIDLSNTTATTKGTNIFLAGYAHQGPTDEVIYPTTMTEFEQIFGLPTTPSERYFYHSAQQIIQSNGTLLTTRLPYGSGSGFGFTDSYSALVYPLVSAIGSGGYQIGMPSQYELNSNEYANLTQNNFAWGNITTSTSLINLTSTSTGFSVTSGSSSITVPYNTFDISGNITTTTTATTTAIGGFNTTITSISALTATSHITNAKWNGSILDGAIVIINKSQTTINGNSEGYYVSLADNSNFGPTSVFNDVNYVYSLTGSGDSNNWYTLPKSRQSFSLSGSNLVSNGGSVSETIESTPLFNFGDSYFDDSLILNVFKIKTSIYEAPLLSISLAETYIGSLDSTKKTSTSQGGVLRSFYLADSVNNGSSNIELLVNPAISKQTAWTNLTSVNPIVNVTIGSAAKALFADGVYAIVNTLIDNTDVGHIPDKITRALTLIENPEIYPVDIIIDGGLTTIASNLTALVSHSLTSNVYDDSQYININTLSSYATDVANNGFYDKWTTIYNIFDGFVSQTRKDCMFIVDPLRQIFINGKDSKVIADPKNTFSQNIYTPLQILYGSSDDNYSATYGNWVKMYDSNIDAQFWCPASGFVGAIYANNDYATYPWFAPAGLTRGIIKGITDIAFNPNQKQRDFLYTISINPIVYFPADGYVVYGQKTLQKKPSAFDRVNVRRLFLSLEKSTQAVMKYFVFEPNTDFTRTRVVNILTPIFDKAKATQGVYDYKIVCDSRNNTNFTIDENELIVDIYLKPVRSAEFILVSFYATRTSQNFNELIA